MKIILAKNIGFCFGVKRAINSAIFSLEKDPKPIQFLGKLIHNEKVTEVLEKKGGKIILNFKEAQSGTLIIGAHGISPFVKKEISKEVLIRDTTCPRVKKAQTSARNLFAKGYQVIIIGDKNHEETKGIKGYTKNQAIVVENEIEAKKLPILKKIGVVSQTTQDLNKVKKIIKILQKRTFDFKWQNTLCPEVSMRQKELSEIIKKSDGILVIGSQNSANAKRLVKIVKKSKKPVWLANSTEELKSINFKNISSLGVVSGTSTPDSEIKKIRKYLINLND